MILDKHGRPMQSQEFEDYKESDFDDLWGDGTQVIDDALAMNTGKAITEKDLLTEGKYPLHLEKGAEVWAVRSKNGDVHVEVNVMPYRWEGYWKKVQSMKDQWKDVSGESKPWYHLEGFVIAVLYALYDVHPMWDEAEFEKVLWREMPEAWISPEFAPKH